MLSSLLLLAALIVGIAIGYYLGRQQVAQLENHHQQLSQAQAQQSQEQMALLREQLRTTSEQLLKERSAELADQNQQQLNHILSPLRESLHLMQESMSRAEREQHDTIARLDESIKATLLQSQIIGERADRLAAALSSENKTQGDFGELRLRTLLENMGLEEGVQFEEQHTLTDPHGRPIVDQDRGKKLRPDVVLHFPDQRDVIIDAKISIKAFEDYHAANNETERAEALKRHVASVRQHANELATKSYAQHLAQNRQSLDFVVMYMFSESALQLALSADTALWKEAYDKGVFITGSQNLYALLRVLEMSWTHHRQIANQQRIVALANTIVSRTQLFYERFLKIEKRLNDTRDGFEALKTLMLPSGQSIVNAAQQLVKLGAKEDGKRKSALPKADEPSDNPQAQLPTDCHDTALP